MSSIIRFGSLLVLAALFVAGLFGVKYYLDEKALEESLAQQAELEAAALVAEAARQAKLEAAAKEAEEKAAEAQRLLEAASVETAVVEDVAPAGPVIPYLTPDVTFPVSVIVAEPVSKIIPGVAGVGIGRGERIEVLGYDSGNYQIKLNELEFYMNESELIAVVEQ